MEISFLNKGKSIQSKPIQEKTMDPPSNLVAEGYKKYTIKNKVDSAEISSSHNNDLDDKRLKFIKAAILYEVSADDSPVKLEELKQKIERGTYEVSSDLLADAILKNTNK